MQTHSRNILLDILKVISSLLVIAFHCGFLYDYYPFINYITLNGILRFVIPFFFCVNGFFLYTVFQNGTFKLWRRRIAILYMIWMLFFGYFWIAPNYNNPIKLLLNIIFGFNHLWYVASFLVGGILLYMIRKYSNKTLLISMFILYLIGYTIQSLGDLNIISKPEILVKLVNYPPSHRNFLFFDLPFLTLGYIIRRSNFHLKLKKQQTLSLIIISFVLLTIESILNYYYYIDRTFSIISISCFLAGPVLLLSAFSFKIDSKVNSKLLSNYSIALYLIHPLIIVLITYFVKLESISLTLVTILLSIISSFLLIQLNKKIKYLF
ncbi:acyltransferase family protein [Aquimarina litoralis]|uniref:acyltransferase family protein n=1 Tax=Aquimarina litoralis TaxID=584605 RepID=UPI003CD07BAF